MYFVNILDFILTWIFNFLHFWTVVLGLSFKYSGLDLDRKI